MSCCWPSAVLTRAEREAVARLRAQRAEGRRPDHAAHRAGGVRADPLVTFYAVRAREGGAARVHGARVRVNVPKLAVPKVKVPRVGAWAERERERREGEGVRAVPLAEVLGAVRAWGWNVARKDGRSGGRPLSGTGSTSPRISHVPAAGGAAGKRRRRRGSRRAKPTVLRELAELFESVTGAAFDRTERHQSGNARGASVGSDGDGDQYFHDLMQ